MKIMITGGAGFIASHVADTYVKARHKVVVIDNLKTGFRRNLNPKAKFYKADIRNRAAMDRIFKKERPEIVNHHAAIAEVVKSLRDPFPTFETNVLGTMNLLTAFGAYGRGGKKKFIFASTGGAIYGEPKKLPANEATPRVPLSPYGLSKLLGEENILFYARHFGFDYTILRYANVYGPRQNPKGEAGVVAIFGGLMKTGDRPTIFGNGKEARDYVFVEDIARANLLALSHGRNEIINLGHGKLVTNRAVFDAVARATNFNGTPVYAPHRTGEVVRIAIDATKAGTVLDWKPKVAFREGVQKTVKAL